MSRRAFSLTHSFPVKEPEKPQAEEIRAAWARPCSWAWAGQAQGLGLAWLFWPPGSRHHGPLGSGVKRLALSVG